jgi:galactokinase
VSAIVAIAPGRVNLIGEHVDYSEGFVLPFAIDRATTARAMARDDRRVIVRSAERDEVAWFDLDDAGARARGEWSDYAQGVARALDRRVPLRGAELEISTTVPIGAGLSSSAAFELAVGLALLGATGAQLDRAELARAAREAENDFVGLRSGIMDQLASAFGVRDHALLIDCRTAEVTPVPIPPGAAFVVADTGVKHELASSAYNDRRAESEAAAHALGAATLRDVTPAILTQRGGALSPLLLRRARHVVYENDRTLRVVSALQTGDLRSAGHEMNASHASLRDDYEVSSPELDLLAATAQRVPGVYGARMTGGGFGGSIVALVDHGATEPLRDVLDAAFASRFGRRPASMVVRPSDGATLMT